MTIQLAITIYLIASVVVGIRLGKFLSNTQAELEELKGMK